MFEHLAYSVLAGVVAFLVALFILPLLTLPASPWAAVIGLLVGAVVYFGYGRRGRV